MIAYGVKWHRIFFKKLAGISTLEIPFYIVITVISDTDTHTHIEGVR